MNRTEGIKKIIKECKNIGERTAPNLYDAGIRGISDLQKFGAEEAYFRIWKINPNMSIHPCYLYALEGAIQNCGFNQLSIKRMEELKKFSKDLTRSFQA